MVKVPTASEWGLQALVLLSFTLQVVLLVLGELRRRIDSGLLRFFVWTADGTAIFVLGHLSVTSRSPEHHLMAFWAPFLLLHLGGQDNITAYAIEDNRLRGLPVLHLRRQQPPPFLALVGHLRGASVGTPARGRSLPADGSPDAGSAQGIVQGAESKWEQEWVPFRVRGRRDAALPDARHVLYTKAEVIHTSFYVLCMHVLEAVATAAAFLLAEVRIVVWHIATNVYLDWWWNGQQQQPPPPQQAAIAKAVEALSNYMLFVLAARPYMLSPTASRNAYVEACYGLITLGPAHGSEKQLARTLRSIGGGLLDNKHEPGRSDWLRRDYGFHQFLDMVLCPQVGEVLIREDVLQLGTLELVLQEWAEMLADSHAKQLGNGGELITVTAFIMEYWKQNTFSGRTPPPALASHASGPRFPPVL
ncbi:hypothetical protein HU200_051016 [Digitaria exilis]|uniref:DUF4220 domain-containing protein n=1 Tax=Digitaria exilis TaxID=1010633 RepID=A0A835ATE6_9POAL|nr:hypothetical protein HU200_051016 [Digitaria exilis]